MRQATNKVNITGLLNSTSLDYKTQARDGSPLDAIAGFINIKTTITVGSKEIETEIPIQVYVNRTKKDGTPNSQYDEWKKVKEEYISVAAGGEAKATAIRVFGNVMENAYVNEAGTKVSYTRIKGSFVSQVDKTRMRPEAAWELEYVVANKHYVVDDDGVETDKYCINALVPQYNGSVDVIPLYTTNPNAIKDLETWEDGSTRKSTGYLNFTVGEVIAAPVDDSWGAVEDTRVSRTKSVSELVILKGSEALTGEFEFNADEINEGLALREAKIENDKKKSSKKAPAKGTATFANLGF